MVISLWRPLAGLETAVRQEGLLQVTPLAYPAT
jgi:hypothetical protein